jgi:hypothetical protein
MNLLTQIIEQSDLENGKTTTSLERVCLLADVFDTSLDYLCGRSESWERLP